MVAAFAAGGLVSLVPALAVMLGANVGTALIVQVLSFNVAALAPLFLLTGVVAFRRGGRTRTRDLGRVSVGLGLILLALHILVDSLAPAESAPEARTILGILSNQPTLCIVAAAVLAWAAHSSVAVVLLVMSLAYSHFVTPLAALALVLGANLGSAINPLFEGGNFNDPASRRLPVGNLINRIVGIVVAYPFLGVIADTLARFEPHPGRMIADFHFAFNAILALAFIGPLDAVAWLLVRILPAQKTKPDTTAPQYLDETAFDTPSVALACAARETLHMGDIVETMMRQSMTALMTDDRQLVADLSRMDNAVDRLDEAIKLYVTRITRESLDERDGRRAMEIISFTINLEHIGDIIDKNLMELAAKKIKNKYQFSKEGAAELVDFHQRIIESLKLAFGVFVTGDVKVARKLFEEKAQLRSLELAAAESHLARLREGRLESIETTSLHLDILRDLKRIHSHICSAAYPALETAGELEPSRLRRVESAPLPSLFSPSDDTASEPHS
jgi:phosphate:Na+ symporter